MQMLKQFQPVSASQEIQNARRRNYNVKCRWVRLRRNCFSLLFQTCEAPKKAEIIQFRRRSAEMGFFVVSVLFQFCNRFIAVLRRDLSHVHTGDYSRRYFGDYKSRRKQRQFVAEFGDSHRKRRLRRLSSNSTAVVASVDRALGPPSPSNDILHIMRIRHDPHIIMVRLRST